jgi:hypothetical protein
MELIAQRQQTGQSRLARLWRLLHTRTETCSEIVGDGTYRVTETTWEFGRVVSRREYGETILDVRRRLYSDAWVAEVERVGGDASWYV